MANSSVRLPVVEPNELTDPKPESRPEPKAAAAADGLAAELEVALASRLKELVAAFDEPHALQPAAEAAARRSRIAPLVEKPTTEKMLAEKPAEKPPALAAVPSPRPEPGVPKAVEALRPPQPRPAPPALAVRLRDAHARGALRPDGSPAPSGRWVTPPKAVAAVAPSPIAAPGAISSLRRRPLLRPVATAIPPAAPPAPPPVAAAPDAAAAPSPEEQRMVTEALLAALRAQANGDAPPVMHSQARQRPRSRMAMAAALLLIAGGAGAMLAIQWAWPRDSALAATVVGAIDVRPAPQLQPVTTASLLAIPTALPNAAAPGAQTPAPGTPGGGATTLQPPRTAVPAGQAVASLGGTPSWLVEDDPTTSGPGGKGAIGPVAAPAPSWEVEDDPASYGAAH